jgi:hypothetical protein
MLFHEAGFQLHFQLADMLVDAGLREQERGGSLCVALLFGNGEETEERLGTQFHCGIIDLPDDLFKNASHTKKYSPDARSTQALIIV